MENKVLMKSFQDTNPEKLCEKVNEFGKEHHIIATQTLPYAHSVGIVAFVYYK